MLRAWQNCLGTPQTQRHHTGIDALHRPVNEVALALDELVVERITLGLADLLQNDLLGRLRRNAPEFLGRPFRLHHDHIAIVRFGIEVASFFEVNFSSVILNLIDHFLFDKETWSPRNRIDVRFDAL